MQTKTFVIAKKNRKYFAATLNGYDCKILIDDNSSSLALGEQSLLVEDISVRSKYGTELIFKLAADVTKQKSAGVVTFKMDRYNVWAVNEARKLGGRWDAEAKVWVFSAIVSDKVDEMDAEYNSELVTIEATYTDSAMKYESAVTLFGYPVAKASGRDSGADLGEKVYLIKGEIDSGGSRKNWASIVRAGTVIRMQVPKALLEYDAPEGVEVKVI